MTTTWLESRREPRNRPQERYDETDDGREGRMVRAFPSGAVRFRFRYTGSGRRQVMVRGEFGPGGLTLADAFDLHHQAQRELMAERWDEETAAWVRDDNNKTRARKRPEAAACPAAPSQRTRCRSIFSMICSSSMQLTIRTRPPHSSHYSASTPNTRFILRAQPLAVARHPAAHSSDPSLPALRPGTICARRPGCGAKTP